jgi:hypothetical protein
MRLIIILLLSISLAGTSCIKDPYPVKGMLVGYDLRDCACCGGYLLNLNDDTTWNAGTKVAGVLPSNLVFSPDDMPLRVQFDYVDGGTCLPESITVTKIKRR